MELGAARRLAVQLMFEHGLTPAWGFKFDRAKRRLGHCNYGRQIISLSAIVTPGQTEAQVRNTILHEIAHALTPGAHHGPEWQAMALAIGCNATRTNTISNPSPRKYKGVCPRGHVIYRDRRRNNVSCGQCSSEYDPKYLIVWSPA